MFVGDLYAQSVLVNKISASELSRKFIKSWLGLISSNKLDPLEMFFDPLFRVLLYY